MATIKKGILGGFSGKVGNVVGASWKDIEYIRSLPSKVSNPRSAKQLTQRSRFSLVGHFLKVALPVVRLGFSRSADGRNSVYSAAMAWNIRYALKGDYPDFEIDFSKVALSMGGLYAPGNLSVAYDSGKMNFTWNTDTSDNGADDDQVALVAYDAAGDELEYDLNAGPRGDGSASLRLPDDWSGREAEAFAFFVSDSGDDVSKTVYAGKLTLQAA